MNTRICPTCNGSGTEWVDRATAGGGTATIPQQCRQCKGKGKVPA